MLFKRLFLASIYLSFSLCFLYPALESKASDNFTYKLKHLKWIAYAPTNFNPEKGVYPSETSIKKDLIVLKESGFNDIVTYGSESTLSQIPIIAKKLGFNGVIMGVWDLNRFKEMLGAVLAKQYVDGYCVGNEGYNVRYTFSDLEKAISCIKTATGRPVTTSEQIYDYFCDQRLLDVSESTKRKNIRLQITIKNIPIIP